MLVDVVQLPMAPVLFILGMAVVSLLVHLHGVYRGPRWLVYVGKPLTTALIVVAATVARPVDPTYRAVIVIGLLFSLAGDIFLMLPRDRFIPGLVSFLLAHVAYIYAFGRGREIGSRWLLLLPYAVVAVVVLRLLWSRLGGLRLPVVVYVAVLVVMAWQAAARAVDMPVPAAMAAAVGAALFVASDATLALNRFRRPFRAAEAVVMSTYVAAQALIALSVS